MSRSVPASSGGWEKTHLGLWLLAGLVLGSPGMARAHDTLGACVQHAVRLAVGAQHIDVTLDLTFFEQWSATERAVMDADGNGVIPRPEQDAYLQRVATGVGKQLRLFVAGRELPLAPLYAPELDLLGNGRVGPAHHRLRLFLFVATPAGLRVGDEIVVEDRFWPEAEAFVTPRAEGREGCRLATERPAEAAPALGKARQPLRITFKCLQPPAARPAAHSVIPLQSETGSTRLRHVVCGVSPQTAARLTESPDTRGPLGAPSQRRDAVGSTRDACAPRCQRHRYTSEQHPGAVSTTPGPAAAAQARTSSTNPPSL